MASSSTGRTSSSSSSSSSSSIQNLKYSSDVFLSFRGEDTRYTFMDHLFVNLDRKGITTFRDDQLKRGEEIAADLIKTIEESRISIIIFSEYYAHYRWCLEELAKIMECRKEMKQAVLPVFYRVDPCVVRKQEGKFSEAFAKHERQVEMKKVDKWRAALTEASNLSGWHVNDGNESKPIEEITNHILKRLNPKLLHVEEHIIGMELHLTELKSLLSIHLGDVGVIGIYGIGGIGKTTIAKIVYNDILHQFHGSSFLEDVKSRSQRHGDRLQLQQELLCGILRDQNIKVSNINDGINMMKGRLLSKNVLVVIDDIDHLDQLKSLIGSYEWFGEGSRIIITTRDKHLLDVYGVDASYEVKALCYEEAIQLFSRQAFKQNVPKEGYLSLSNYIVDYAQGLPLALKVLGSFLYGMTIFEWKSALVKLKKEPNKEIQNTLKISYDGLSDSEKDIFLDIACFFKGRHKDFMSRILEDCNFYPDIGIRVLCDKCLISISSDNMVQMHDLIQQMGWAIVREQYPKEPSRWSRLWDPEDIHHAFSSKKGMKNVEVILYDLPRSKEIHFNSKVFAKMEKLRLLKVYWSDHCGKIVLPADFEFSSQELRYLYWEGYPLKSLPSNFHGENLVQLRLRNSTIKRLWKGNKGIQKLKVIDLRNSKRLTKISKFISMPNLERLDLRGCTSFRKLPSSIGDMKKLTFLNLEGCQNFQNFPKSFGYLGSLEVLNLNGCQNFEKFPEIHVNMKRLQNLSLNDTAIKELPSGLLEYVRILYLNDCSGFENFPEIQKNESNLRDLRLRAVAIKVLPFSICHLVGLRRLDLEKCKYLVSLPDSICGLKSLEAISLKGCSNLKAFPEIKENMEHLEHLYLSDTTIKELPSSIENLTGLKFLELISCENLLTLPNSIGNLNCLRSLLVRNCSKLHKLPDSLRSLQCCLRKLDISGCNLIGEAIPNDLWCLSSIESLDLSRNNVLRIPTSIKRLSKLKELLISHCRKLEEIPELPSSVRIVQAHGCPSLETLSTLTNKFWSSLLNCFKSEIHTYEPDSAPVQAFDDRLDYWMGNKINIVIPESSCRGIPEWIWYQCVGSEEIIELPLNWYEDSNFLGLALFSHHVPLEHDDIEDEHDIFRCELTTFHGDLVGDIVFDFGCTGHWVGGLSYSSRWYDKDSLSDPALWVTYFPHIAIGKKYRSNQCRHLKASFIGAYQCGNNRDFKVRSCGFHLMYDSNDQQHGLFRENTGCNIKRSRNDGESRLRKKSKLC